MEKEVLVADVLAYYRPSGWHIRNNDFNQITWCEAEPITFEEYEAGIELVKAQWAKEAADALAARTAAEAKLAALGLTTDDLKALGLGTN
jgi:hypothetical protein